MKARRIARRKVCRNPMLRVGKEPRTSDFLTTFLAAERGHLCAAHMVSSFARSRHVSYRETYNEIE
jgi:hypothetical protein